MWLWPWQFEIELVEFVTISEGSIGIVEAKDGVPLKDGRVLARRVDCDSFQNARLFLKNGGERGPQITIIPPERTVSTARYFPWWKKKCSRFPTIRLEW
jgi:uncharacterized membrane protein YqiK